jgi:dienelactone hydrolase
MSRKVVFALWMVFVQVALIACGTTTIFNSLDINREGGQQILRGRLTRPSGDGPFPAIVLLHGCNGTGSPTNKHYSDWIYMLQRWDYVSLLVDSFGPRGKSNICASGQGRLELHHNPVAHRPTHCPAREQIQNNCQYNQPSFVQI